MNGRKSFRRSDLEKLFDIQNDEKKNGLIHWRNWRKNGIWKFLLAQVKIQAFILKIIFRIPVTAHDF